MSDLVDNIDRFHTHDIFYSSKTIKIFGEINESMMNKTISNLHTLDQTSGDVTILLSSEGGCVTSGMAIIDAIRAMKNNVNIIAYGGICSMASVIFQAADQDRRFMMPNSFLMIHEGESEISGKQKDIQQWKKLLDWQEKICIQMYDDKIKEKKPRYKKKTLIDNLDKDWIIFPKEAVELGLADKILEVY